MPRPPFAIGFVEFDLVQAETRVGFKIVHDPLWPRLAIDNNVNVIRTHMRSQQAPVALR